MPTPSGLTGAPRRLLTLCRVLKQEGIDVCVISEPDSDLFAAAEEQGFETIPFKSRGILGLRHGALFGNGVFFKLRVVIALLRQNLAFARLVRKSGADVVWLRGSKGIAFAAVGAWIVRKPLVWDVVGEVQSNGIIERVNSLGLCLSRIVVLQYKNAGKLIFGQRRAEKHAHKMFSLIPGIELNQLEIFKKVHKKRKMEQNVERTFKIMEVGTICENKNQRLIVDTLVELMHMNIDQRVLFRVAGHVFEEDYAKRLKEDIENAGLQENVEFLGWRDDIHDLMSDADILVMPSLNEGIPNAVQESMYIGLPVIVSDTGGMPEIVEHGKTGWVLSCDDPRQWAEQIAYCMTHPEAYKAISQSASKYAKENFGMASWGHSYAALVDQASGKNGKDES